MATPLRMPDIGTVEGDVTLVRWLKAEGDTVALGEPLFEVETDKGVSEVESALAGVLVRRVVAEGAKAATGETIALIRRPGEADEAAVSKGAAPVAPAAPAALAALAGTFAPPSALSGLPAGASAGAARIAPTIRALAEKWGVDLAKVRGTGPGGLVMRADVLRAKEASAATPQAARQMPAQHPATEGRRLTRNQAVVARKVSQSHREKPVYHVSVLVDMSKAIAHRDRAKGGPGTVPSFDAILVKAVAKAIDENPVFRGHLAGEEIVDRSSTDIAVALGIGDELYAPAVRGAGGRSTEEITLAIEELARKVESHALVPQDVEGSCFLVSNLGMFPIESFDAVIYPEHSAALAVGAAAEIPVADRGSVRIAPIAKLTLSVDHRLINGNTAARFLARVRQILQDGAFA